MALQDFVAGAVLTEAMLDNIVQHLQGQAGSTDAYHLRLSNGNDLIFTLSDNAGARAVLIKDSDGNTVASIDSNGVLTATSTSFTNLDIPASASPSQTTDGRAVWDSDDDVLTIGDGSSRKTFGYVGSSTPQTPGTAAAGSSNEVSRADHVHASEWTYIEKAATETVNNSNTLQSDDDFLLTAAPDTDYLVEMYLPIASGTTPDWKFAWTLTGMTWDGIYVNNLNSASASFTQADVGITSGTGKAVIATGAATANIWRGTFLIHSGSTGGTLNFQWAQNTADPSNTSVLKNALMLHRSLGAT